MQNVEGQVSSLAFGGEGVLKDDKLVVFVPFTAPGDSIVCQITDQRKNFARGEVIDYKAMSPLRVLPNCPYFGHCGGCQLQHLGYESQVEFKRVWVEEALRRIGHLSDFSVLPVISSPKEWHYRRHITLNLRQNGSSFEAGYFARDNQTLIAVQECEIFIARSDPFIKQVQEFIQSIPCSMGNEGRVTLMKRENSTFLLYFQFKEIPNGFEKSAEQFLKSCYSLIGLEVAGRKGRFSLGDVVSYFEAEGLTFAYSPKAFLQNNGEQSLNIYRKIVSLVGKRESVLDLYCGIGITSLLLSAHVGQVVGIEGTPHAVELAKGNAHLNHVENVTFVEGDVRAVLQKWVKKSRPEVVIVNPPRVGLDKKVVEGLLESSPSEIIYLSCMPSTLARDLSLLCREKYRIDLCQPFDMFPQTGHIETLVHLRKNK